jgi:1-phosphatidylinositol-4-phosphate 5-kinase
MFLLILITSGMGKVIQNEKGLPEYALFTTILTCLIPTIVGIIRNCRGFTKIKTIKKLTRRIRRTLSKKSIIKEERNDLKEQLNNEEDQFDWLEQHSMEFFMRDILLSVAYCINESKSYDLNMSLMDFEKENESSIKHTINLNTFKLDDPTVTESQFIDVKIIDYAPKIFAYLRSLENIDIDKMAESFLPKNNKKGISESQGKSGSFFISTDDNQYMIKTLKVDEFDLIRKTFLNEYEKYIKKNPNSLLCRIYGMYNIILSQGEEILIIVMRNVIGEFKEYVMAKYDLKGSTKNRVTEFDMEKLGEITLKDLNFNELEKGIKMSSDSIATFRTLIKYDALFLRKMELMDYSLFLVKLTFSKEQISDLFGEEIQDIQENEYKELMEGSGVNNNNIVTSFTFNEKRFNYGDIYVKERKVKIKENVTKFTNSKYYKQYIYPSLVPGQAYILAIIDYFQIFNFYKYVEATFKGIGGKGNNGNSCVEPRTYAKRFINYFNLLTDIKFMLKIDKNNDPNNFVIIEEMIDENEIDDLDFLINIDNDSDKKQNVELKFIG